MFFESDGSKSRMVSADGHQLSKAEPAGTAAAKPVAKPADDQPCPPEELITLRYDSFVAAFSSYCGGLKSWQLTDARYARDATHGRLLPEKSQLTTSDANGNAIPVPPEQMVNVPDCGAFHVNFALSTFVVPHHAVWKGEQRGPRSSERSDGPKLSAGVIIPKKGLLEIKKVLEQGRRASLAKLLEDASAALPCEAKVPASRPSSSNTTSSRCGPTSRWWRNP